MAARMLKHTMIDVGMMANPAIFARLRAIGAVEEIEMLVAMDGGVDRHYMVGVVAMVKPVKQSMM